MLRNAHACYRRGKNSFGQLLTNRLFNLDFNISLLRRSSHSCAQLQVMFQCRSIAVPKQIQNYFISITQRFKSLPFCKCEVFPLDTLSFTAWFIIWSRVALLLTVRCYLVVFLQDVPDSLQRTCFCPSTSCPGTDILQTLCQPCAS